MRETTIKIKVGDNEIILNRNLKDSIIKQLSIDEIFDSISQMKIHKSLIFNRIEDDFREEIGNLLNKFFNHKSDANKYLMAEQQEDMENDFMDWADRQ